MGSTEKADHIHEFRLKAWNFYKESLIALEKEGIIELPKIPPECEHNGHIFYIKVKDIKVRTKLLEFLKSSGILAVFHYVPLHSSPAGLKYGRFHGEDKFTTKESERLIRLPLFYGIKNVEIEEVVDRIYKFYGIGG
jgi:Predicted pyridoxal phosphate-dependent enzyme apparently involved in regulation of cell wall biogenesis